MPIFHTALPENIKGHYGEYLLGLKINEIKNDQLEIWFNVNYLPGVPDIDLIIFEPTRGLYIAEVKSFDIEAIEKYDLENLITKDEENKRQHPVKQIRTSQIKLKDYINEFNLKSKKLVKPPFIQTTVIWSKISREQWKKKFTNPQLIIQSNSMLFADDLKSNEVLLHALQNLWQNPLLGIQPPPHTRKIHDGIREFKIAIENSKLDANLIKERREELIKSYKTSKHLAESFTPGKQHFVLLEGAPGTGKTTVLREIGLEHSAAGGAVLHICYNKVLAADQKNEYQILKTDKPVYGFIDVYDEFQFYKTHVGALPGPPPRSEIKNRFIEQIKNKPEHVFYDTILIDEAQDLQTELFEMIEMVARPKASWFISYGKGQEIFGFNENREHPSKWLQNFFTKADRKVLRRSFRNTTRAFLLGQSFWENYPDLSKAKDWFKEKYLKDIKIDNQLELELSLPISDNDFEIVSLGQEDQYKKSIKTLLIDQIENARKTKKGSDLLIIVSKKSSLREQNNYLAYKTVLECLDEISKDIKLEIQDLIPDAERRNIPVSGSIRIVTHQSVRGLSASHVLVFDLDHLEVWCEDQSKGNKGPLANYGYICFSRSKSSTVIVRNPGSNSSLVSYMSELTDYARIISLQVDE